MYLCSNCRESIKRFSLFVVRTNTPPVGRAYKFGEIPAFGPPTPPRLLRLFGEDRELFMKGRRCESQGLGIGAFVYYRRVVENHKNQIFDQIIKVSELLGLPAEKLEQLKGAQKEISLSKAMSQVNDPLPEALLINGQNPITLLHRALSGHLHAKSDQECLELAQAVRVVLIELAEKLAAALKDEVELANAVKRLMQARS